MRAPSAALPAPAVPLRNAVAVAPAHASPSRAPLSSLRALRRGAFRDDAEGDTKLKTLLMLLLAASAADAGAPDVGSASAPDAGAPLVTAALLWATREGGDDDASADCTEATAPG